MLPVIIFDYDGTLFWGTTDINVLSFNRVLDFFGLPPISRALANETVGDTFDQIVYKLFGKLDAEKECLVRQMIKASTARAIDEIAELPPQVEEMLAALAQRTRLAICSNADPGYMDKMFSRFGISRYFSCIWTYTPGYTKRTAIPAIMKNLGARSAIMVGDRQEDVDSGQANGCITVAVKNEFGDSLVDHADHIVLNHEQMRQILQQILDRAEAES